MIEFSHVSKLFGTQKAVNDLNLNFQEGSFSVLIGTSGSGKSTTLKMINRLVEHDSGVIRFAGEEIRSLPVLELRRRMGYAIQSIGLFPHWSVAQNIASVPQLQKWSRARIDDRIDELMALLGLEPDLRERYPHQLSGGQQQRVGVARALAADPQVLLMDEPFGALDPVTRGALQQEMTRIHRLQGRTIVLVTHDIDEALRLAEHLVLMDHGEVVQQGNPLAMLTHPANDFVRQFFGRSELGVRLLSLRSVADYVWSRARIDDRIDELMALLGLEPDLRERYPHQLSGGQQQRVGVARALAADPQVLLMDEPFGALDPVTRGALQQEMTRIHRLQGRTIVLVTHDIDEALRLAEHLVLMDHGEVVQQGNPLAMLTHPANDFVRQFFGRSELGVRLLSLRSVADYVRREERAEGEALEERMTLRDALSLFVARGCEVLPVVNTQGEPCGTLHFQDLLEEA